MRRSARLATKAETDDECAIIELKTPTRTRNVTQKKQGPNFDTSTAKKRGRPKKLIEEENKGQDAEDSSRKSSWPKKLTEEASEKTYISDVKGNVASKQLFPLQEFDHSSLNETQNGPNKVEVINPDFQVTKKETSECNSTESRECLSGSKPPRSDVENDVQLEIKSVEKIKDNLEKIVEGKKPNTTGDFSDDKETKMTVFESLEEPRSKLPSSDLKELNIPSKNTVEEQMPCYETSKIKSNEVSTDISPKQALGIETKTARHHRETDKSFQVISRVQHDETSNKLNSEDKMSEKEVKSSSEILNEETIKEHSRKDIKVDIKKPSRKYTFNTAKSNVKKSNLLQLTSDIFKNIPFNISKEDILSESSDKKKIKSQEIDVHKLDVISLSVDNDNKDDKNKKYTELSSELDPKCDSKDLYFDVNKGGPVKLKSDKKKRKEMAVMKKSVLGSDLEKRETAPKVNESMRQKKKKKKKDDGETAGSGWFNMPKTEMTEEIKKDLQIIKMRNILDPKRFYKKADKKMPKYFQVGTVIEGATEFYSSRISKKDRKRNMVDELLEDAEFRRKNKKKYLEIQSRKESGGKKYYKKMKNKKKETWARK